MMKQVIAFAAGVLVGSGTACVLLKEYFSNKAQEEIDSVVKAFRDDNQANMDIEDISNKTIPTVETSSIDNMKDVYNVKLLDYRSTFEGKSKEDEMRERATSIPYVISPAEVNFDEYDSSELIYYADGVLAYPDDTIVTDIFGTVGNALNHFGEYEEDTVLVNNDRLKLCIEITKDSRKYVDVTGDTPPNKGGD